MKNATTNFTATQAVIYNNIPKPSFWRHPVKWWKWDGYEIIGTVDLASHNLDGITVYFEETD